MTKAQERAIRAAQLAAWNEAHRHVSTGQCWCERCNEWRAEGGMYTR